jgi:hypothetical protein
LRQVRHEIGRIRDRASSVSIAAGAARLIHPATRQTPRGLRGTGVAIHPARMQAAAFSANEYRDDDIEDGIVRLNPIEPEFAVAELAVQGRRGLDEVMHMPPPFVRHRSQRLRGTLKGAPINMRSRRKPDALVWRGDCDKRWNLPAPKTGATRATD